MLTIEAIKRQHIGRGDLVIIEIGFGTTAVEEGKMREVLDPFFREREAVYAISRPGVNSQKRLTDNELVG